MIRLPTVVLSAALLLSACTEEVAEKPAPMPLPDTAIGYFCGMTVAHHNGPKGQIFLKDQAEPIWFVSVQDTLAFTRMPDEAHRVRAVYVTDMGIADDWDHPSDNSWRDASTVWFVVGADVKGGMGASEVVPFSDKAKAQAFAGEHGGGVLKKMGEIETDRLLGSGDDKEKMVM